MWWVVLSTICVVIVLLVGAVLCYVAGVKAAESEARKDERAGLKGAAQLRRAVALLNDMVNPTDLSQISNLNTVHRERALGLLADYNTIFRKGK